MSDDNKVKKAATVAMAGSVSPVILTSILPIACAGVFASGAARLVKAARGSHTHGERVPLGAVEQADYLTLADRPNQ